MILAADFETTVNPQHTDVWAWGLCPVADTEAFQYGTNIDGFIAYVERMAQHELVTVYFHNLKFDGEFIIYWLLHNGFTHVTDSKELDTDTFSTLISDMGQFYSIEICFGRRKKALKKVKLLDSLKLIPMPIAKIPKAFGLPIKKLEIDYERVQAPDTELTEQEVMYLRNDVQILAMGLDHMFKSNLTRMTIGSNALAEYKDLEGKKNFNKYFPQIEHFDADIRRSYKGGFTYCDPRFAGQDIGEGIVLDVNSLYPSRMKYCPLPYGEPVYFDGRYQEDKMYPLYVQHLECQFKIKPYHIPTIQVKHSRFFVGTEYLTSSNCEVVDLVLTSVDLALFFEHYEVFDCTFIDGFKFHSAVGLFDSYIDKWNNVKVRATEENNPGLRTIAKLMLNNLYGKFSTNPESAQKYPYLGDDDCVHYQLSQPEHRDPVYIPVGSFITAWARDKTIRSAQQVYDRFLYADTDSLHLIGTEIPSGLEVHPSKLGAWKHESTFERARFLRQKCYIEQIDGQLKVTCAGMPDRCHQYVTWENFHIGVEIPGKLKHTHVPGGVLLAETPLTIRP